LPTGLWHCWRAFANNYCSPVGEWNDSRVDGVLPSPTEHVVVDEAFPTGPAFLLVKRSFPSFKTPTVFSQQERTNPAGKSFANRIGVLLLAKRPFPVVPILEHQPVPQHVQSKKTRWKIPPKSRFRRGPNLELPTEDSASTPKKRE
jgi:hypothetical protein